MTTGSIARLTFRKPRLDDLARVFDIYRGPRTQRFNPAGPMQTLAQAEALLGQWLKHWEAWGYGSRLGAPLGANGEGVRQQPPAG